MLTPILTQRLRIRTIESIDIRCIHRLHSLPETDEYNTLGIPVDIEHTTALVEQWMKGNQKLDRQSYTFAITLCETNVFAGLIALIAGKPKYRSAEVWFKLFPEYWHKGYATEALKSIIFYGFHDLNLHRIEAGCAVENIASMKVLENAGMKQEGRRRKKLPLKSGWADNYEYAILAED